MSQPPDESTPEIAVPWLFTGATDRRLAFFTETMRAISRHRDPQQLVADYYRRMGEAFPTDGYLALSRRNLAPGQYRFTRSSTWGIDFDPWKQGHVRPIFDRGLFGDLIYGEQPTIIDDLTGRYADDDPGREFLDGHKSLLAVPMFDDGEALNMICFLRKEAGAFDAKFLPDQVWVSNLFGRATNNLVLRQKVDEANRRLREEMEHVGEIQRTLLPESLPEMAGLKLAAYYDASTQAGGDYYDFFEIPGDRLGILVADVSGHGTPAAVLMAVVHAIAHAIEDPPLPDPPGRLMAHLNRHLCERYTKKGGTFVTAWYGVLDPARRRLTFANAGHPSPRLKRDNGGPYEGLAGPLGDGARARSLPLGIDPHETFPEGTVDLESGDVIVAYTDGITEARAGDGSREMWGTGGLDAALTGCRCDPQRLVDDLVARLATYTGNKRATDDRTIVVAKVG